MRVFIHGAAATPTPLIEALARRRDVEDVSLYHLHTAGPAPFADPGAEGRFLSVSLFAGAPLRDAIEQGRADFVPIFLSDIPALPAAPLGEAAWATSALIRHARLARRVRARFERLRPRPVRQVRQPDGSEIDLSAYVTAAADVRAGATVDGRVYVAHRPARRELAVALLLDVSASTDAWVSADRRIVDVEKEALLVVCEALDALGDRYAVFAFSGEGAGDVSVLSLKRFDERVGLTVRRRIAALDADRYTRLGAPIRHVTAALCREPAPRRLLLVLSDGKPNDADAYEGRYGVEDTRQAVAEARRQGVAVFCLTVDREAPRYATRIFGRAGFAVLHRTEQLPSVLIDVLRQLIRQ
jgi:nitric oxide reductase NorD protein